MNINIKSNAICNFYTLILTLSTQIIPILVFAYEGYRVINGSVTIGTLVSINTIVYGIFTPIKSITDFNINLQRSYVAINRINTILEMPIENEDVNYTPPAEIKKIKFNNIKFSYSNNDKYNLDDVTFTINSGEKTGIVGFSGSGKTTILKILTGLYTKQSGNIEINDVEINDDELVSLRRTVAIVQQEPILLNESIYNNIVFGNENKTIDDVIEITKKLNMYKFITNLNSGFQTIIGKNGVELSIGQKQRIVIARALITSPKILILDEITSNIDKVNEKYIIDFIFSLPTNIMVLIISHDMNIIEKCNNIIIVNDGKIDDIGTHQYLIKNNNIYKRLNRIKVHD